MNQPRYITLSQFREYLSDNDDLGTSQNGLMQSCIVRAESAIDNYTRRNFAGTVGTVYYNRSWQDHVVDNAFYLDRDLYSITGLITGDSQIIPIGSLWLEPQAQDPPYRIIRLMSSYVYTWNTDSSMAVSGYFGYSTAAPDDVVQATLRTAAYYWKVKDTSFSGNDVAGFPQSGETPITQGIPQDTRWLLAPYRSRSGGVI